VSLLPHARIVSMIVVSLLMGVLRVTRMHVAAKPDRVSRSNLAANEN
jgi:hypothetical protein